MAQRLRHIGSMWFSIRSAVIGALMLMPLAAAAQNDVMLTQFWAVPAYYNPAATGEIDYLRIRGGGRMQWLGIENAPKSFLVSGDMPVKIGKKRVGVGLNMNQESLGLFSNMAINVQGSYKLKFLKGMLSIGVEGGYFTTKFRGSEVYLPEGDDYHQGVDEAIPTRDLTGNTLDLSAGLWYTHRWFTLGISAMHLLDPTVRFDSEGEETAEVSQYETQLQRRVYFTASGNIAIKNTLFELQPALMVESNLKDIYGALEMRAVYNKFLSFGAGYRYKDAVSVMVGAEFKNFFIGYSYDYPLSAISKVSSGSHELMLGYRVKLDFGEKNRNKHRSIRIM